MTVGELKEFLKYIPDDIEIQVTGRDDKIPTFFYMRWMTCNHEIKELVQIN